LYTFFNLQDILDLRPADMEESNLSNDMSSENDCKSLGNERNTTMGDYHSNFMELKLRDTQQSLNTELEKLIKTAPPQMKTFVRSEFEDFQELFGHYLVDTGKKVDWDKIKPPRDEKLLAYDDLPTLDDKQAIKSVLDKLVVCKLNGGLGTSMGCTGPKSLISVRNDMTFLDLAVQQIEALNKNYGCNIPLVLMCSFNTIEESEKIVRRYNQVQVDIKLFTQSTHPRLNKETLLPIATNVNYQTDMEAWYPPGHGNFFKSFFKTGMLQEFLDQGREYIFVSNMDNLGANVDFRILNFLLNPGKETAPEFVMEVTDKTRADIKGGTLVEIDKKIQLLELAQVPSKHVDSFKSINKFKIFNTNNIWANLSAIKRVVKDNSLKMEIIVNPKTMDNGVPVIQLEQAIGAAIQSFNGALGINVPRRRFLPVKITSDLLIVKSNLYNLKQGILEMSPSRVFSNVPLIKLGTSFTKVKDFNARFGSIPDIIDLDHLTVSGDVTFGKNVVLKGTVIIIANHGDRIDIPDGSVLENKIVSGNLRILDH